MKGAHIALHQPCFDPLAPHFQQEFVSYGSHTGDIARLAQYQAS